MLDPHSHIRVGDSTMHVAVSNRCKKPESANIKLSCPLLPSYGKARFPIMPLGITTARNFEASTYSFVAVIHLSLVSFMSSYSTNCPIYDPKARL